MPVRGPGEIQGATSWSLSRRDKGKKPGISPRRGRGGKLKAADQSLPRPCPGGQRVEVAEQGPEGAARGMAAAFGSVRRGLPK